MSFHSVLIQKLLNTNAHLGRRVTTNHFKIFSEGTRNSRSIIDADKTLVCIRNACNFIGNLARNDARFLFVNTNSQFDEIVSQMTETVGVKNDATWRLGGFLTNSSSPRKFRGRNKKFNLSAVQPPDCIVLLDTAERRCSVINEAYRLQIPVVGLVDSSMPWDTFKRITYPVPANDSLEFVYLFCNLITKTILKEQREAKEVGNGEPVARVEEAERDDVTERTAKKFVFPYEKLPAVVEDLSETKQLLDKLVIVKYNGDLGTKVGFSGPKSAMEIRGGLTGLDLIINQIEALNAKYGCNIPLLLVNAINTHDSVLKLLKKHLNKNIHSVMQIPNHLFEVPSTEANDKHDVMDSLNVGDVLRPLIKSGKLDVLLSQGKEYMLMLSSDNLAQIFDPKIMNYLIENDTEFCLEVTPKSSESGRNMDEENAPILTPKKSWKFTDTMWVNIDSIESLLEERTAKDSLTVSKLFDEHFALNVPKSRHLPVETTSDLFLLQSDLYTLAEGILTQNAARENSADPSIELGQEFEHVADFQKRFKTIPSILGLESLNVTGDVWFGTDITLKGKVAIRARPDTRIVIPDGAMLENTIITRQEDVGGGSS